MEYIVTRFTEDGEVRSNYYTKLEVLVGLDTHVWGENPRIANCPNDLIQISQGTFVGLMITKGPLVVPTPKEVVSVWTLD